ncbi:hypothetical protein F53441_2228 [Fusarium austroafricanum]|uniref:HhH-GPD domain-containing protein n=1 Tax=Fusarium austroafricanum TaxID=2364996 RepID=A0A8H4KTL5_9HYPO|nr:hypothetical protein F53441_2228 [Fusarium austroafricanum]
MVGSTTPRFGSNVLSVFDVPSDAWDFLADVIESSQAPNETEGLFQESLLAGAQNWHHLIECANSMRGARPNNKHNLQAQDVLEYVWYILDGQYPPPGEEPWELTDRLIAQVKELEVDPEIRPPHIPGQIEDQLQPPLSPKDLSKSKPNTETTLPTSHYWSDQPQEKHPAESGILTKWTVDFHLPLASSQAPPQTLGRETYPTPSADNLVDGQGSPQEVAISRETPIVKPQSSISPYFTASLASDTSKQTITLARKRPQRGTVPSVPFAPLTSPGFGLIQEKFAHEPFWLLVVVTFLIRTKGTQAIPIFYEVKRRFPTPSHIACEENTEPLLDMIRHLGLAEHRVALIKKYAQGFLNKPPIVGTYYKVKKYDHRDFDPSLSFCQHDEDNAISVDQQLDLDAWEIGHLTQGKYALDSWRIFCRDELLGRAKDWNGGGRGPEFQPEWMRVRPDDKELRAYLRWMWMKEGWEWNPATGERVVLSEELRNAVNEGRIEYDDTGSLKCLAFPSSPLSPAMSA